jgi:hypothetical protein
MKKLYIRLLDHLFDYFPCYFLLLILFVLLIYFPVVYFCLHEVCY